MTSFKLQASVKANDCILVRKYRSDKTGLTVIVADIEGPVVNGYFALSTEAHDDDGLPHTLEHLIFLGSELYPYKGVLDLIANRCLASGTNAWTDTDHTCYTMTTAGSDGFLSLLPIYLDHILYPTLTDAGFFTEVHHISGDGEDSGVVYCEMQGRENTGESRVHLEMLRAIYPDSGYCAETGGIMKNLRESTTNEKVRAYHQKFYRPDNLTIIVTGKVEPEAIFKSLEGLEERIVSKGELPKFERPWMSPIAPLADEMKDIKILYPSDEEDCGIVNVAYRGPMARTEHRTLTACSLLMRYLSDTSVSPLQRELVETKDPHASKISYNIGENSESLLYFSFENVPMEKIDKVYETYAGVLRNIVEGREKLDMKRFRTVIEKGILETLSSLEGNPHEDIAFHSIGYILYGETEEHFDEHLNPARQMRELLEKDEEFWLTLMRKYFVGAKYVVIRAVPSIAEKEKMAKEELERIEQQRNDLGKEGLAKKEEELAEAMQANELPPPVEMLTQVDVPSVAKINFHSLEIFKRAKEPQGPIGLDLNDLPIYAEAYNLSSNFVYMILSLNTEFVPVELRPYLLLLLELFTESPILRNGELIPYEEVVAQLEADTVTVGARIGLETNSRFSCGPFSNTISILIQVEPEKYAIGAKWLTEILHKTQFTVDRIRVTAAKMANDVAQAKRNGNATARALLKAIYYKDGTNSRLVSLVQQHKFLSALLEKLETPKGAEKIISDLNKTREIITSGKNVAVHIAANWNKLHEHAGTNLLEPWKEIVTETVDVPDSLRVIQDYELINAAGNLTGATGVILGLGSVESAFLFHTAPCINDFNDPDLPALNLFLQYLLQLEGPLWRQIRGAGLAYGYSIAPRPNEGLLYLSLYKATNVVGAFKEAKAILEGQLQKDSTWDETLLESARSSLIFEVIEREKSVGDVVVQALLYTFKQTSVDYNKKLVQQINAVTLDDLTRVGQKYVAPLFSKLARTSIVCHPDKCSDIAAAFEQFGYTLKVETSLEDSILS